MCDANIFPVGFIVGLQLHYYSFHRDITGFLESSGSESHSVMSNSLQPHGIATPWNCKPMEFSKSEYWSG